MEAKVRAYRGIVHADINLEKITLIAGLNYAGKSSICEAVAAALTSSPLPYFKPGTETTLLSKKDAGDLVNGGHDMGGVLLKDENGTMQIGWRANPTVNYDVSSEGEPPKSSRVAAGLVSPIDMDDKERAKFYGALLKTKPTKDDYVNALTSAGLVPDQFPQYHEPLWAEIEIQGFEATYQGQKAKSTRLTGQWEGVTGTRYGSNKAESYLPENWVKELEEHTLETHEELLARAKQDLDNQIAKSAVSDSELEALKKRAEQGASANTTLEQANKALSDHETTLNQFTKASDAASSARAFACAHCGGVNLLTETESGIEATQTDLAEKEVEANNREAAEAKGRLNAVKAKHAQLQRAVDNAEAAVRQYAGSLDAYNAAKNKKGSRENVDFARDFLNSVQAQHEALTRKLKADEIHGQVVEMQTLLTVLEPQGIRQEIMVKRLAEFNQLLATLCTQAKFGQVSLSDDLLVQYDAANYFLISKSEKWRCKTILAIATALKDGSAMAILDEADMLDQPSRNGMFGMLAKLTIPVMVAMTLHKQDQAPDLAAAGLGHTYWISEGRAFKKAAA